MSTTGPSMRGGGHDEKAGSTARNRNCSPSRKLAIDRSPDSPTSRSVNCIAAIHVDGRESTEQRQGECRGDTTRCSDPTVDEEPRVGAEPGVVAHDIDDDGVQSVVEALEKDAALEKELNTEMASVVIDRLETAKSCAEKILSVLQALATAERAYSKSLKAIGSLTLTGEADGSTLREALTDFVALPARVGAAHEKATQSSQPPINLVRDLVGKLREACTNVRQGSLRVHGDVEKSAKAVKLGVESHREVCRAFEAATAATKANSYARNVFSSHKSRTIETDPWIAEVRVVERRAALRVAQVAQRAYLADAFQRVEDFERQRITVTSTALSNAVENMMYSVGKDLQDGADAVLATLSAIDGEADLAAFRHMAGETIQRGEHLSSRQAEMIGCMWRHVEGSAEIVRQGPVKRLVGCSWAGGHAVLTRSGFLHWFKAEKGEAWSFGSGPVVSINLTRCQFELGDAPSWRLLESTAGSWWGSKVAGQTYSTTDVDSCMEWTASLKEMIEELTNGES